MLFAAISLSVLAHSAGLADELRDFESDGCSAFPDGTYEEKELWRSCCVVHDFAYWIGGSSEMREEADQALKTCVEGVDEPDVAKLMLAGVRVGGTPWLPTRFRWAYGWPYLRGYKEVDEQEALQVADKVKAALELLEEQGVVLPDDGN